MHSYHLAFSLILLSFITIHQYEEKGLPVQGVAVESDQVEGVEEALPVASNIIFKSEDGGQSWQDISMGLPTEAQAMHFYADRHELFLGTDQGVFRNNALTGQHLWVKEELLNARHSIASTSSAGAIAFSYSGGFSQKITGTDVWMPIFTNFTERSLRNVFEASDGSLFIGCDNGLFKSADQGYTWKQVVKYGWVIHIVESKGVMLCTNQGGILRSDDGGENWEVVLNDGGVGIAVEVIDNGFAAITYSTTSETRRVRISTDAGKSWQPIDDGLPPSMSIASIHQVDNYFLCGHPQGIFRSADRGKTWELLLPSIGEKVFNLFLSGNVVYAVAMDGGC